MVRAEYTACQGRDGAHKQLHVIVSLKQRGVGTANLSLSLLCVATCTYIAMQGGVQTELGMIELATELVS